MVEYLDHTYLLRGVGNGELTVNSAEGKMSRQCSIHVLSAVGATESLDAATCDTFVQRLGIS